MQLIKYTVLTGNIINAVVSDVYIQYGYYVFFNAFLSLY